MLELHHPLKRKLFMVYNYINQLLYHNLFSGNKSSQNTKIYSTSTQLTLYRKKDHLNTMMHCFPKMSILKLYINTNA